GDNRRPRLAFHFGLFAANFLDQRFFRAFFLDRLRVMTHLLNQNGRGVLVNGLVDGGHDAELHHALDQIATLDRHTLSQIGDGDQFRNFDIPDNRRGRTLEAVISADTDRTIAPTATLLTLASTLLAFGNVQLLALAMVLVTLVVFFRFDAGFLPGVLFRAAMALGGTPQVF